MNVSFEERSCKIHGDFKIGEWGVLPTIKGFPKRLRIGRLLGMSERRNRGSLSPVKVEEFINN
jgi:hypothetical protein